MALFLLFESAHGHSLFRLDEIGQDPEAVRRSVPKLNLFDKLVKPVAFHPVKSAFHAIENYNSFSQGLMTDELRNFLERNLPKVKEGEKPTFSLGVPKPKIGSHIFEVTKIPCQCDEFVLELLRGVRQHFDRLIKDLKVERHDFCDEGRPPHENTDVMKSAIDSTPNKGAEDGEPMAEDKPTAVKNGDGFEDLDPFSKLADEIVASILSRLAIKEAGKTCVLARRWKKLWTFITVLDFDALEMAPENYTELSETYLEDERSSFVFFVYDVMKAHCAQNIEKFRIHCDLNHDYREDIDHWIKFAILRDARRLDLIPSFSNNSSKQWYSFPSESLDLPSFPSLTDLHLKYLKAAEGDLHWLFAHSPKLERVSLISCRCDGVKLEVASPCKLKHLEISFCFGLESILISTEDLLFFEYEGPKVKMVFEKAPRLTNIYFGGPLCKSFPDFLFHKFDEFSRNLSQLKTLKLDMGGGDCVSALCQNFPLLTSLKNLELEVCRYVRSLLPCMALVEACPSLDRFKLKASRSCSSRSTSLPKVTRKFPHRQLKVVELLSFTGAAAEMEVAVYLIENALLLEKVIVYIKRSTVELAREQAMRLGTILPTGAELVMF